MANLWRVVRELDLQAIRREALSPFDLLIVADSLEAAAALRESLAPGHPWVRVAQPGDAHEGPVPNAVIVLSRHVQLDAAADANVRRFRQTHVPVVVAHLSSEPAPGSSRVPGYVTIAQLDARAAESIAETLIELLPMDERLAYAHQLSAFRRPYFDLTIDETSRANATYAFTTGLAEVVPVLTIPLNLGDIVILTKNQLLMGYRLVLAAGRDGDPRKLMAELLGVLGGGFLFRQVARQLVGLIPIVGLLPKVAIAYGGTWAIGRAVTLWLTEGREVTSDLVRSLAIDGLERGRIIARDLVERARSRPAGEPKGRWPRRRSPTAESSRRPPPSDSPEP